MRIKLSIGVSNLLGASGLRILHALAQGETDPRRFAELGDERLHCTEEQVQYSTQVFIAFRGATAMVLLRAFLARTGSHPRRQLRR